MAAVDNKTAPNQGAEDEGGLLGKSRISPESAETKPMMRNGNSSSGSSGLPSPQSPPSSPTSSTNVKSEENKPPPANGQTASSSGSIDDKRINNNTASYTAGGRLKFYKEGRCLLELTHRSSTEGQESWVPITKKVYWPPPGPVKAESSPSVHSASEAGSDVGSSIPSPWQPSSVVAAAAAATGTSSGPPVLSSSSLVRLSHRLKSRPRAFRGQPPSIQSELCFGMKPPACIVSLRKKVRNLRRKRRQPYTSILVGAFLMRLEVQAVKTRPPLRPVDIDRIKKASRLEATVTKLSTSAKRAGGSTQVHIQAWKSKGKDTRTHSSSSSHPPPMPPLPQHISSGTRIKSELCPVTETCTAATMPSASPSHHSKSHKVKTEKVVMPSSSSTSSSSSIQTAKTMPITPTIARIKGQQTQLESTSLISPDMQRVKVEIGHSPYPHYRPPSMPALPTSPVNLPHHHLVVDQRDSGHFVSPRKRYMRDLENGSPSMKRSRLSTDSRGSSSEGGGGAGSPASSMSTAAASPPRTGNQGAGGGRVSSFSIDSIMSSSNGSDSSKMVHRPVPIPASPARISDLRGEARSRSPLSPQPQQHQMPQTTSQHTPLVVPVVPYTSRAGNATPIDPRLAHLAGVAADPRLGLTPTYGNAMAAVMSSYYSPFALASQIAAASAATAVSAVSNMWTSPAITTSASMMRSMRQNSSSPPNTPSRSGNYPPAMANWNMQYRGEPRVATAVASSNNTTTQRSISEIFDRRRSLNSHQNSESADMPLNLSVKK